MHDVCPILLKRILILIGGSIVAESDNSQVTLSRKGTFIVMAKAEAVPS